jgi:hypothetical protein
MSNPATSPNNQSLTSATITKAQIAFGIRNATTFNPLEPDPTTNHYWVYGDDETGNEGAGSITVFNAANDDEARQKLIALYEEDPRVGTIVCQRDNSDTDIGGIVQMYTTEVLHRAEVVAQRAVGIYPKTPQQILDRYQFAASIANPHLLMLDLNGRDIRAVQLFWIVDPRSATNAFLSKTDCTNIDVEASTDYILDVPRCLTFLKGLLAEGHIPVGVVGGFHYDSCGYLPTQIANQIMTAFRCGLNEA